MKKKYALIIASICLIGLVVYAGYIRWNSYVMDEETIASLQWVEPLSQDSEEEEDRRYKEEECNFLVKEIKALKEKLKEINLQLVVVKNNNTDEDENDHNEKLYGIENSRGEVIIPARYESIDIDLEQGYILAGNYYTKQYHYYKLDGSDLIKENFENASRYEAGYACVEKQGKHLVISPTGEELLKVNCDSLSIFDSNRGIFEFSNDSNAVYKNGSNTTYVSGSLTGLIDISGNILLEPKYELIFRESEDKLCAEYLNDKGQEEYLFLDNSFNPVSGKIYESLSGFYQGSAIAKYNGEWFIINEEEEVITKLQGCIKVHGFSEGIAVAECYSELKYINTTGKTIFTLPYKGYNQTLDENKASFSEGKIVFPAQNGKLGYMDSKGNVVVEPIFNRAGMVKNGQSEVKIGNKRGVIKF
ncbi:WG repeat-containing protein [Aminipila sp.]|uniref:WG repeat-containing protein n=1 Tax=Aminipila sp. TaxID=2060095 RepID=UPI0028A22A1E|nr:WG repeat-containing protein [Aminipila sp.]